MARYDPFRGKKVSELLDVKPDEFRSWDMRKQRAFVTRIASATNKRVRRLDAAEVASSARQRLASEGGPITARGKESTDDLLREYQRARTFLTSPTGNVQGARRAEKARNEALEKYGINPNTWTFEQASEFEVMMNRYRDYARDRGVSYQQLAQAVDTIMKQNTGLTEDDLSREVNNYINKEYQRQQRRWNEAKPGAKLTTTPGGRPLNGTPFRLVLGGKR